MNSPRILSSALLISRILAAIDDELGENRDYITASADSSCVLDDSEEELTLLVTFTSKFSSDDSGAIVGPPVTLTLALDKTDNDLFIILGDDNYLGFTLTELFRSLYFGMAEVAFTRTPPF
jgi:hypothetical protein